MGATRIRDGLFWCPGSGRSKQHDNEGGGTPAVVEWHEQLAPFTGASTALAVDGTALGVSLVWSVAVKVVLVNGASIDGIHSSSSSSSHPSTSLPHVEVSLHETFGQLLARCLPALEGTTTSSSGRGSTSASTSCPSGAATRSSTVLL